VVWNVNGIRHAKLCKGVDGCGKAAGVSCEKQVPRVAPLEDRGKREEARLHFAIVPLVVVRLQCWNDPSTTRAGAHKPSAGKSRPASVGMTRSRGSQAQTRAARLGSVQDGVDHVR